MLDSGRGREEAWMMLGGFGWIRLKVSCSAAGDESFGVDSPWD